MKENKVFIGTQFWNKASCQGSTDVCLATDF